MVGMETNNSVPSRRGRPPKIARSNADTRALLINTGLAVLTEKGFSATGIDLILKSAQVPKGSFYHYFKSKNDFGLALIDAYDSYFQAKLKRHLTNSATTPLERIVLFANDAKQGMAKFEFKRGCLIGNLNQELSYLDEPMIDRIKQAYTSWQALIEQCLVDAKKQKQIPQSSDCKMLAEFFWIGWEGAVMRSKLDKSIEPLTLYTAQFLRLIL
jgi:TetR/AcrR family transcriptional repressor of nem operon